MDTSRESLAIAEVPIEPNDLSPELQVAWKGLWSSPVAQLLDPVSDMPVVVRLFELYTLAEKLGKLVNANVNAVISGTADEVDHKLLGARMRVTAEIRNLENTLGLSPRSRLALGLALLAGKKAGSLDDMADEANDN